MLYLPCLQVELFNAAVKAQVHGVKVCSEGLGVERHFYALKCLAEERGMEVPKVLRGKVLASASLLLSPRLSLVSVQLQHAPCLGFRFCSPTHACYPVPVARHTGVDDPVPQRHFDKQLR